MKQGWNTQEDYSTLVRNYGGKERLEDYGYPTSVAHAADVEKASFRSRVAFLSFFCILFTGPALYLKSSLQKRYPFRIYRMVGNIGGKLIWRLAVETKNAHFISAKFNIVRHCVGVHVRRDYRQVSSSEN